MSHPVQIHRGRLVWSGEHWINALRRHGEQKPSAWFSLFHTRWSARGEGNAAQLVVPSLGLDMVCTDNRELAAWVTERFFQHSTVYNPDAPVVDAIFSRAGDVRREPAWVIETRGPKHGVVARWSVREEPVIASGSFKPGTEHFTALFFTNESSVEVDGRPVEGAPYLRDIWAPTIGGQRSSSVFALAETLLEL